MDANEIKAAAARLERLYGGESYEIVYGQDRTVGGLAAMDEVALVQAMIARLAADEAASKEFQWMAALCHRVESSSDQASVEAAVSALARCDRDDRHGTGLYADDEEVFADLWQVFDEYVRAKSADEAERAERAKPADDEWLYSVTRGSKWRLKWDSDTREVWLFATSIGVKKTRGDWLELLSALNLNPKGE